MKRQAVAAREGGSHEPFCGLRREPFDVIGRPWIDSEPLEIGLFRRLDWGGLKMFCEGELRGTRDC